MRLNISCLITIIIYQPEWMRDNFGVIPGLENVAGVGGFIEHDVDCP